MHWKKIFDSRDLKLRGLVIDGVNFQNPLDSIAYIFYVPDLFCIEYKNGNLLITNKTILFTADYIKEEL